MKPYNSEIIKLMAAHSDECAAYASAMKWDFWRRQKVGDVSTNDITDDCAFCKRYAKSGSCGGSCLLYKIQKSASCAFNGTLWNEVRVALRNKDQQAFTQNANDLYYLIRAIIDDFYKAEPKKEEVFYKVGDRFEGPYGEYVLSCTDNNNKVVFINISDGSRNRNSFCIKDKNAITRHEIDSNTFGTFTLIDKK